MKDKGYYLYQAALIAIVYSTLVFLQLDQFANDPGVGWHLKTGELILKNLSIPFTDPFLSSPVPRAWISDQWLSDAILYGLYQIGNFPLIYALGTGLFLLIFTGILFGSLIKNNINPLIAMLAAILAVRLASIHFILRPVIFSFLLFTMTLATLVEYHQSNYSNPRSTWKLPLIFLLWANLHPSFVIGLILLVVSLFSIIVDKFFFNNEIDSKATNHSVLLLLACFAATLVNPYCLSLHTSILSLGSSKYFMNLHSEWLPMDIREPSGDLFFTLIFGIMILLFLLRENLKLNTFSFLVYALLGYMAVKTIRFAPYFGISMSLILAGLLNTFFSRINSWFEMPQKKFHYWLLPSVAGVFLISFSFMTQNIPFSLQNEYGPDKTKYPYQAVDELIKVSGGQPISLLSHPNWGGFITWRSNIQVKPLLDDRNTMVGEEFHKEVMEALKAPESAIEYAKKTNMPYVLYRTSDLKKENKDSTINGSIYRDDQAVLIKVN